MLEILDGVTAISWTLDVFGKNLNDFQTKPGLFAILPKYSK